MSAAAANQPATWPKRIENQMNIKDFLTKGRVIVDAPAVDKATVLASFRDARRSRRDCRFNS